MSILVSHLKVELFPSKHHNIHIGQILLQIFIEEFSSRCYPNLQKLASKQRGSETDKKEKLVFLPLTSMKTTFGKLNISKTLRAFKLANDPVSTLVHLSSIDILRTSRPSRYLKSPLMTNVIGFDEMSRYLRFLNLVQAEVSPKLKFGMSL